MCSDPVIPVFIEFISLSKATVFIELRSPSNATVFIEYKARFSRRLSSACPLALRPIVVQTKELTKGRRARPVHKREVRRRRRRETYRESGTTTGESSAKARESSAPLIEREVPLPPKLTGSRQQRCSSRSTDPLWAAGILKTKGYCTAWKLSDCGNYVV